MSLTENVYNLGIQNSSIWTKRNLPATEKFSITFLSATGSFHGICEFNMVFVVDKMALRKDFLLEKFPPVNYLSEKKSLCFLGEKTDAPHRIISLLFFFHTFLFREISDSSVFVTNTFFKSGHIIFCFSGKCLFYWQSCVQQRHFGVTEPYNIKCP
jgi:hypothetical protein